MPAPISRIQVLQMIEDGQITAAEGLGLLEKLAANEAALGVEDALDPQTVQGSEPIPPAGPAFTPMIDNAPQPDPARHRSPDQDPKIKYWQRWWLIPFFLGLGFTALSGLALYGLAQVWGPIWSSVCLGLPVLFGLGVTAVAWMSRKARWIHVRVDTGQTTWPQRISISLPVPLGLVAWLVRTFGWRIPAMQRTAVDDVLLALDDTSLMDAPIFVEVNEGQKGERVQVYIG